MRPSKYDVKQNPYDFLRFESSNRATTALISETSDSAQLPSGEELTTLEALLAAGVGAILLLIVAARCAYVVLMDTTWQENEQNDDVPDQQNAAPVLRFG